MAPLASSFHHEVEDRMKLGLNSFQISHHVPPHHLLPSKDYPISLLDKDHHLPMICKIFILNSPFLFLIDLSLLHVILLRPSGGYPSWNLPKDPVPPTTGLCMHSSSHEALFAPVLLYSFLWVATQKLFP